MTENVNRKVFSSSDDAVLIKRFLNGNRRAFDELVLRHKDRVYNLCYNFFEDHQEANDMAQEVFIKVFKSLKKFRQESAFSTWLYRIAINTCKNRVKSLEYRFRRWRKSLDNPGAAEENNPGMDIEDNTLNSSDQLEQKERSAQVRQAISTLSEGKKTVVLLRDMEGFSYEEISDITGLNIGTVRSRLARARDDLKTRLSGVL